MASAGTAICTPAVGASVSSRCCRGSAWSGPAACGLASSAAMCNIGCAASAAATAGSAMTARHPNCRRAVTTTTTAPSTIRCVGWSLEATSAARAPPAAMIAAAPSIRVAAAVRLASRPAPFARHVWSRRNLPVAGCDDPERDCRGRPLSRQGGRSWSPETCIPPDRGGYSEADDAGKHFTCRWRVRGGSRVRGRSRSPEGMPRCRRAAPRQFAANDCHVYVERLVEPYRVLVPHVRHQRGP